MAEFGRLFIGLGILFLIIGSVILLGKYFSFLSYFGKLPGDIRIQKENFSFYFPLTTSILLSVVFSLVLLFIKKFF